MKRVFILCLFFVALLSSSLLISHEGHHTSQQLMPSFAVKWIQWIGQSHLIFLHFPIALIIMVAISDVFFYWKRKDIFNHASLFMLYATVFWTIPTVLSGLALGYGVPYNGLLLDFFQWHRALGIILPFATVLALVFREFNYLNAYIAGMVCLVVLVTIIGILGGGLAFGPDSFIPPSDY